MAIRVSCEACSSQFGVSDQHAGKRIRCPKCQSIVEVPGTTGSASSSQPVVTASADSLPTQSTPRRPSRAERRERRSRQPAQRSKKTLKTPPREPRSSRSQPARAARPVKRVNKPKGPRQPWLEALIGIVAGVAIGGPILYFAIGGLGGSENTSADATIADAASGDGPDVESVPVEPASGEPIPAPAAAPAPLPVASNSSSSPVANTSSPRNSAEPVPAPEPASLEPSVASSGSPTRKGTPPPGAARRKYERVELFEKAERSVVRISVQSKFGGSTGSGYVVDRNGTIVTNYHVVEGAVRAKVVFKNGNEADVLGHSYLNHRRDIAVIRIDPNTPDLEPIPIASALPKKGESVYAFGAPLGLDFTASEGIVSAIRQTEDLEKMIGLSDHQGTWVQTTAPISPGNSGGPLVNEFCEVVAMNTMQHRDGQNLNFALSCEDIRSSVASASPRITAVSPSSIPVRLSQAPSDGGADDGSPRPRGAEGVLANIVGTKEAQERLAALKECRFEFYDLTQFPEAGDRIRGSIYAMLEKQSDFRLVHHDAPVMLVFVRQDGASVIDFILNLELFEVLPAQRRINRVWRDSEKVMSVRFGARRLPRDFDRNIRSVVNRFRSDVRDAKKAVAEAKEKAAEEAEKE